MTDAQSKLIDQTKASIERAENKAAECDRAGLSVLARGWHHVAKCLQQDLDLQIKSLKGEIPEGFR